YPTIGVGVAHTNESHSVAKYRRLLPRHSNISDEELARMHDQLSLLARAICNAYWKRNALFATANGLSDEERASVEERAAILEFDGRLSRKRAEAIALATSDKVLT